MIANDATAREPARYTRTAVALHWLIAALFIGQFAWGWLMQEIPKSPPGMRADAFNFHKSIGLCLLGLMLFRLGWRIAHRPPALPPLPVWQARLAQITHVGLYVALIVQPVAGYLGSVWSGYPVKLFGVTLPAWGIKNERGSPRDELCAAGAGAVAYRRRAAPCVASRRHRLADVLRRACDDGSHARALARRRLTEAQSGAYFRGARAACSSSSTVGACLNSRAISSAFLPRLSTGSTRAPASINTRAVSVWP
jgi:cytochrome b561